LFFVDRAGGGEVASKEKTKILREKLRREREAAKERAKELPKPHVRISKALHNPQKKQFYQKRASKRIKRQQKKKAGTAGRVPEIEDEVIPSEKSRAPGAGGSMDIWGSVAGEKRTKAPRKAKTIASLAKAIHSRPIGAQSYNPEKSEQKKLIKAAAKMYDDEIKEKQRLHERLAGEHDLPYIDPETVEPDEEPAPEPGGNPVVRAEDRLTRKQIRKKLNEKRLKEAKKAKLQAIKMKMDFDQIKGIVKKIVKVNRKGERKAVAGKEKRKANELDATKGKLGKRKFEPLFPEVLLTDEVTGNLRDTEVSGEAAATVFNRLQERKLIEPRGVAKRRRRRLKRHIIKMHKD